jgi:hypothetical protein
MFVAQTATVLRVINATAGCQKFVLKSSAAVTAQGPAMAAIRATVGVLLRSALSLAVAVVGRLLTCRKVCSPEWASMAVVATSCRNVG